MQDLGLNIDLSVAGIGARQQAPRSAGMIKATDGVIPLFYKMPIFDKGASEESGEAVYRDVDYVEIVVPGQRDKWIGPVNEKHIERFAEQYESYKRGDVHAEQGTPITHWQGIPPQRAQELRALRVYTVEILAELPDSAAQRLGQDFNALRKMAQKFVAQAGAAAALGKTVEQQQREIADMAARQAELEAELARMKALQAHEQGRPVAGALVDATIGGTEAPALLDAELAKLTEEPATDADDAGTMPGGRPPRRR